MEVQLAYAIGVAEPVSVMADTFGTGTIPNGQITELIRANFKLTPKGIIEALDLRRPIYRPTAAYGHSAALARDSHGSAPIKPISSVRRLQRERLWGLADKFCHRPRPATYQPKHCLPGHFWDSGLRAGWSLEV